MFPCFPFFSDQRRATSVSANALIICAAAIALVVFDIQIDISSRLGVAEPVRSKHRIYWKALVAFVISKHVVLEELMGQLGIVGPIELIVDYSNPRTDAGQGPHFKLYLGAARASRTPMCSPAAGPPPPSVMALFTIGSSPKFAVCCAPI